jgi:hypothetical protein
METTLNALNGKEIKEILAVRMNQEIAKIPYLKEANTFFMARINWAFSMSAYPADVPVPKDQELEFDIKPPTFSEEDAERNLEMAEYTKKLLSTRQEIDNLLEKYMPTTVIKESYNSGATPDSARIENNLPIPMEVSREIAGTPRTVEAMFEGTASRLESANLTQKRSALFDAPKVHFPKVTDAKSENDANKEKK